MTRIESETISCPACNKEQETTVYETINAMEDPELVQKLLNREINLFRCAGCGHEALIQLPLLFNDHRIDLKIQYFPEHWLEDNPEGVCNDYLGMLKQMEHFRQDFGPFMPGSDKQGDLLVIFSMDEMVNQIKFKTKLFEVENDTVVR